MNRIWLKIIVSLLLVLFSCGTSLADQDVILITSAQHKEAALKVGKHFAKEVFLGDKTRWNGGSIKFVTLKSGKIHNSFLDKYLNMTSLKYKLYWKKRAFTGKGKMPKSFSSEEKLVRYLIEKKGYIGYVSSSFPLPKDIIVLSAL